MSKGKIDTLKSLRSEAQKLLNEHCSLLRYAADVSLEEALTYSTKTRIRVRDRRSHLKSQIMAAERFLTENVELDKARENLIKMSKEDGYKLSGVRHFHHAYSCSKTMHDYLDWGLKKASDNSLSYAVRLNILYKVTTKLERSLNQQTRAKEAEALRKQKREEEKMAKELRNTVYRTLAALATGNTLKDDLGTNAPENLKTAVESLDKQTESATNAALVYVLKRRKEEKEDINKAIACLEAKAAALNSRLKDIEVRFEYGKETNNYVPMLDTIYRPHALVTCCGSEYDRLVKLPKGWTPKAPAKATKKSK